jgi:hypothetical protein
VENVTRITTRLGAAAAIALLALVLGSSIGTAEQPDRRASKGSQGRLTDERARAILDAIYKGDYRRAFAEKRPELFLQYLTDDFTLTQVDGTTVDLATMRENFSRLFAAMDRTIEHNVNIEDVDVLPNGNISAVVTLNTLIEFKKARGEGTYLVTNIGTYRDEFAKRNGQWRETQAVLIRDQTTLAPRP